MCSFYLGRKLNFRCLSVDADQLSSLLQLGLGMGHQEGAPLQCSEGSTAARPWEELHTQGTCRKAFSVPLSTVFSAERREAEKGGTPAS